MKRNIVGIYALAVCFVAVVCAVVAAGIGAYDLVEIAAPKFTLESHLHERHQSNEAFRRGDCDKSAGAGPSEEEQTRRRLASYATAIESERRDAVQSLVKVVIVLVLNGLLFLAHWKLARRSQPSRAATR